MVIYCERLKYILSEKLHEKIESTSERGSSEAEQGSGKSMVVGLIPTHLSSKNRIKSLTDGFFTQY